MQLTPPLKKTAIAYVLGYGYIGLTLELVFMVRGMGQMSMVVIFGGIVVGQMSHLASAAPRGP